MIRPDADVMVWGMKLFAFVYDNALDTAAEKTLRRYPQDGQNSLLTNARRRSDSSRIKKTKAQMFVPQPNQSKHWSDASVAYMYASTQMNHSKRLSDASVACLHTNGEGAYPT